MLKIMPLNTRPFLSNAESIGAVDPFSIKQLDCLLLSMRPIFLKPLGLERPNPFLEKRVLFYFPFQLGGRFSIKAKGPSL